MLFATKTGNSSALLTDNNDITLKPSDNYFLDGNCYIIFTFESSEELDAYAQFWLQPSKYSDDSYTVYTVLVNGCYAGNITPQKGNWQNISIDGNVLLKFKKGLNTISVFTAAPETPDIELVRISCYEQKAQVESVEYDRFLEKAIATDFEDCYIEDQSISDNDALMLGTLNMYLYTNVPLKYTFHKSVRFTAGQQIFITSSSTIPHIIDFFYEHRNIPQQQGLSWLAESEATINTSSTQVASTIITIPATGYYKVRVRSKESGVLGTATININGAYYYEDSPIYYRSNICEIPANGQEYVAMTRCAIQEEDDPALYIEGGGSTPPKVVEYNDDGDEDKLEYYNLSSYDSYIKTEYLMETNLVSINMYHSSTPASKCDILARITEQEESAAKRYFSSENTNDTLEDNSVDFSIVSGGISVNAQEKIEEIRVYSLAGELVWSTTSKQPESIIPIGTMSPICKGIYVIDIKTAKGKYSEKIRIY